MGLMLGEGGVSFHFHRAGTFHRADTAEDQSIRQAWGTQRGEVREDEREDRGKTD